MPLSTQRIAEIVCDDEEYVRRISPTTICKDDDLSIISIPRSSFTAYRLSHVSPVELSLSSKVVLLGGVPSHWKREQIRGFLHGSSKIGLRGLRRNGENLSRYGYRDLSRTNKTRRQPASAERCDCKVTTSGDHEYQNSTATLKTSKSRSTRSSSFTPGTARFTQKRSQTLADVPKQVSFVRKGPKTQHTRDQTIPKRETVAVLPTLAKRNAGTSLHAKSLFGSDSSTDELSTTVSETTDNESSSADSSGEEQEDIAVQCKTNLNKCFLSCDHLPEENLPDEENATSKLTALKMKKSESDSKALIDHKPSLIEIDAKRSDASTQEPSLGLMSTVETTPVSFMDSPYFPNNAAQVVERKSSKIRFDDEATQYGHGVCTKGKRRQIVRLKPTFNSDYAESLQLMVPEPDRANGCSENHAYSRHFKTQRLAARRVGDVGGKAKHKFKKGFSGLLGAEHSLPSPFLRRLKRGKIIMMEKMLVMVKLAVNKKDPVFSFSQEESIDTRVSERWKEYIVVARSTGKGDSSILLQFYRRRHIPTRVHREKDLTHGSSLDFQVDSGCLVGIYGNLDKTLYIQKVIKNDSNGLYDTPTDYNVSDFLRIYILKCSTLLSSGKWYNVLRSATKTKDRITQVNFKVPEAEVSVDIKLKNTVVRELTESEDGTDSFKLCVLRRGYRALQHPLMRFLTVSVIEELRRAGLSNVVSKWELVNVILGCNYKHFDLLQWCSNSSSTSFLETFPLWKSYVLEFRPYVPPPREAIDNHGCVLIEPTPIEGFLIRLTNRLGNEGGGLRKLYFRPSYFFTNDNLLFFMSSFKACPPSLSKEANLSCTRRGNAFENLANIHEQDPYPLDLSSHISWLKGDVTPEDFEANDLYALKCFSRRVDHILKAEGVIDLCEIDKIYQGTPDDATNSEIKYRILHFGRRSFWDGQDDEIKSTAASILNIETRNGLILRLMARSPAVCEEWTSRLRGLMGYWKAKNESDCRKMWNMKSQNMKQLRITDIEESNINDSTPKWIMDLGITDTTLYNVNALCQLRPLLHKGFLYQKPKKHSTFTKYMVVLIPGFLVLYKPFERTTTGFPREVIDYKHYLTLPITNCYLYSGSTSRLDLVNRRNKSEEITLQSRALPRAYSDGWRSSESESSRCFTLWFGKKRAMLAKPRTAEQGEADAREIDEHQDYEKNPNAFRMVSRLGVSGKSMVFMARSRQERNLWVLSISSEIEKLKHDSEISV